MAGTTERMQQVRETLAQGEWRLAAALLLTEDGDRLARAQLMLRYGLNEAAEADIRELRARGHHSDDLDLADALRSLQAYGNPEVAARTAERLLPAAAGDGARHCRCLLLRAIAAHRMDRWEKALRDIVSALAIAKSLGDKELRVELLKAMATVEAWRGRHSQALLHLTLAIADCAATGDNLMLSELLGDCGRLNLEMRRHAHALEFFDRQEDIAGRWLEGGMRLRLDLNKARALAGLRRHAEALRLLDVVETAAKAAKLDYLTIMSAHCRGRIHLQKGDAQACLNLIARLRETGIVDPMSYEHTALQSLTGEAGMALGDLSAKSAIMEVIDLHHARRLVVPEVEARLSLANRLADRGEIKEAESLLKVALTRCRAADLDLLERKVREAIVRLDVASALEEEDEKQSSSDFRGLEGEAYVLISKLGSGGFATVFRAYDIERDRDVAFKRFVHPQSVPPEVWQAFERSARSELKIAARLRHPAIARTIAIGNDGDGSFYTVQDFIAGPSLRSLMATENQPSAICRTIRDIAATLAVMHEAGITHRDIKPENIVCPVSCKPVILDLGIASLSGSDSDAIGRGTAGYAAPEQWAGDQPKPPNDVFSLGVTMHEWLLGHIPDPTLTSSLNIFGRRRQIDERSVARLIAAGAGDLTELLEAMISYDPTKRPDAREVAERLDAVIADLEGKHRP